MVNKPICIQKEHVYVVLFDIQNRQVSKLNDKDATEEGWQKEVIFLKNYIDSEELCMMLK